MKKLMENSAEIRKWKTSDVKVISDLRNFDYLKSNPTFTELQNKLFWKEQ